MGRPKMFVENDALDAAMHVFWAEGYEGTSYSSLTKAMRMNRPSIYRAFGDKENLFLLTITRYAEIYGRGALVVFDKSGTVREGLHRYARETIKNLVNRKHPGCLVGIVLSDAVTSSPKFKRRLKAMMSKADAEIESRIRRAVEAREISKDSDLRSLAQVFNSVLTGFALRARAGETAEELYTIASNAIDLIFA